jgi:hypothetical protein
MDESLGELLESNIWDIWDIVTHDIYYTEKQLIPYLYLNTLKEYVANPLNFYKENLISKKGE